MFLISAVIFGIILLRNISDIDDEEITDINCDLSKVREKMGMVFRSFNLFANLNVIENIMAGPVTLLKMPNMVI